MCLQMLGYGVSYWQELWKAGPKRKNTTLPAILPIVLFTGEGRGGTTAAWRS